MEVRNRFKGLDLIDRVLDELWMEVCDIVQETGIIPSPRKRSANSKMAEEKKCCGSWGCKESDTMSD